MISGKSLCLEPVGVSFCKFFNSSEPCSFRTTPWFFYSLEVYQFIDSLVGILSGNSRIWLVNSIRLSAIITLNFLEFADLSIFSFRIRYRNDILQRHLKWNPSKIWITFVVDIQLSNAYKTVESITDLYNLRFTLWLILFEETTVF